MTAQQRETLHGRLGALAWAEFVKIWVSRTPAAFLLAIVLVTSLISINFYWIERAPDHLHPNSVMDVLPLLYFVTWKMMLFHFGVIGFGAYWTTLDSQHGMIRVTAVQPISRLELLIGKWLAILAHVALFGVALILCPLVWAAACSGLHGIGWTEAATFGRFSGQLIVYLLAFTLATTAAASFRRSVGAGIVTALLTFAGLAMLTMLHRDLVPPRLVLIKYWFFPIQEFGDALSGWRDSPLKRMYGTADFLTVTLVTPLLVAIPALLHFQRRDITE
jgi:ABC-type transport system involved in multi-copper enzyme maturation permease subunit